MGKATDYYKYLKTINSTDKTDCFIENFKNEQDIVLLIDVLSIEFVPEHLRCFKSFDGSSVIGYFLGTLKELGYNVTYEEAKRLYGAQKKRFKHKNKYLIRESLEV